MQYLTYDVYSEIGGVLDLTAFNRHIGRACGIIDNATYKRIEEMGSVPEQAKLLCRDLIEFLSTASPSGVAIQSKSHSAGAVSESESYAVKSKEDLQSYIDDMVIEYLASVTNDNGVPLLYRGASR